MKRFTFLASLFSLPLLGQKRKRYGIHADDAVTLPMELIEEQKPPWPIKDYDNPEWYTKGKALNNQCPQCGTMAPAWTPKSRSDVVCADPDYNGQLRPCPTATERRIDCERCNTTFRQRAE